jgi:hypothetical protein
MNTIKSWAVILIGAAMLALNSGCYDGGGLFSGPTQLPNFNNLPDNKVYSFQIEIGVTGTPGQTYTWEIFHEKMLGTLTFPPGDQKNTATLIIADTMCGICSEDVGLVSLILRSSTGDSAWLAAANFEFWISAVSLSTEVKTVPSTEQKFGPIQGWRIGESKTMTFKYQKTSK